MKRTTIYLDPDLEVLLKLESKRQNVPMAEVIRLALRNHLEQGKRKLPPGVGEFESGRDDIGDTADEILSETRFGEE